MIITFSYIVSTSMKYYIAYSTSMIQVYLPLRLRADNHQTHSSKSFFYETWNLSVIEEHIGKMFGGRSYIIIYSGSVFNCGNLCVCIYRYISICHWWKRCQIVLSGCVLYFITPLTYLQQLSIKNICLATYLFVFFN